MVKQMAIGALIRYGVLLSYHRSGGRGKRMSRQGEQAVLRLLRTGY